MKRSKHVTERTLFPGSIVILDLDEFEELMHSRGWSEYKPNEITGELTSLVEKMASDYQGVVIYGLDYKRGTEEAVIEFPGRRCHELSETLRYVKNSVNALGAGISIVCVEGFVSGKKALDRKEAYHGTPWRDYAAKILRKIKNKGGNTIFSEGKTLS